MRSMSLRRGGMKNVQNVAEWIANVNLEDPRQLLSLLKRKNGTRNAQNAGGWIANVKVTKGLVSNLQSLKQTTMKFMLLKRNGMINAKNVGG